MSDFARLKKSSSIEKLTKALENQNKFARDERYWEPVVDKAGNGFAVIRFLAAPAVDGDDAADFITMFTHGFKGPTGKWYIENSLTTLGENDPVSEYNTKLWETGIEANKKKASDQKRKLIYVSNILVVKDSANPENEGKVFLFKYGKKIMDKIKDKAGVGTENSEFQDPDDVKFNAFNFWEGANFKLKIRKVEGYRNYDKSEFETPSALFNGNDTKIEELWRKEYSLKDLLDKKNFKSYDELKKKLDSVLGLTEGSPKPTTRTAEKIELPEDEVPSSEEADRQIAAAVKEAATATESSEDEFAEFARLADSE